jgi:hypothetical protein
LDVQAYDETLRLLRREHLPVRASRYDPESFGSWYIDVATTPAVRLVWDGKDRQAIVQTATALRLPPSKEPWEDRWTGRGHENLSPLEFVQHALDFARLDLKAIEAEISRLGTRVGAGPRSLPTFGHTEDFGRPHIEVDVYGYHYIVVERGEEISRFDTTNLDALLYHVMIDVTSALGYRHELAYRVERNDSRRMAFAYQLELLGRLSTAWQSRWAAELDELLQRHPFDDDASVRAQYTAHLRNRGVAEDAAWAQALDKYPLPAGDQEKK